jgi:hypothetical protein
MTPLRQKMINDMNLRRFAIGTQKLYVYAVEDLAKYYKRSPDLINEEEALSYPAPPPQTRTSGIPAYYVMQHIICVM